MPARPGEQALGVLRRDRDDDGRVVPVLVGREECAHRTERVLAVGVGELVDGVLAARLRVAGVDVRLREDLGESRERGRVAALPVVLDEVAGLGVVDGHEHLVGGGEGEVVQVGLRPRILVLVHEVPAEVPTRDGVEPRRHLVLDVGPQHRGRADAGDEESEGQHQHRHARDLGAQGDAVPPLVDRLMHGCPSLGGEA